jgi:apolipoprotein N-acyltransferase
MKNYKTFDFYSQTILIVSALLGGFDKGGGVTSVSIIAFAVLQIVSLLVHFSVGKQPWKESLLRKIHLVATSVVMLIMIYGMAKPSQDKYDMSGLGIIFYALIPAALVALFYTVITFLEWKKLKNRP